VIIVVVVVRGNYIHITELHLWKQGSSDTMVHSVLTDYAALWSCHCRQYADIMKWSMSIWNT